MADVKTGASSKYLKIELRFKEIYNNLERLIF